MKFTLMREQSISKYFKFKETIVSTTADNKGIKNIPSDSELRAITWTARFKMDPIREILGVPLIPTSWFRSPEVNKLVGGSTTSDHLTGTSVDFYSPHMSPAKIYDTLRDFAKVIDYDQLILYPTHVHIGFRHPESGLSNRNQAWKV